MGVIRPIVDAVQRRLHHPGTKDDIGGDSALADSPEAPSPDGDSDGDTSEPTTQDD